MVAVGFFNACCVGGRPEVVGAKADVLEKPVGEELISRNFSGFETCLAYGAPLLKGAVQLAHPACLSLLWCRGKLAAELQRGAVSSLIP